VYGGGGGGKDVGEELIKRVMILGSMPVVLLAAVLLTS
jgi:hypothetical protein